MAILFVVQIAAVSEKNGTTVISISHLEVDMEVNPLSSHSLADVQEAKTLVMALHTSAVIQCCGFVSGIRCFYVPGIRDG
jgi:hypothetical protein